jgi:hypothetical protein
MRVLDRLGRPGNGARVMFRPPVEVPQWSKPPRSPPSPTIITTRVLTKHEIVACAAAASRTHGEAVRHWPSRRKSSSKPGAPNVSVWHRTYETRAHRELLGAATLMVAWASNWAAPKAFSRKVSTSELAAMSQRGRSVRFQGRTPNRGQIWKPIEFFYQLPPPRGLLAI